MIELKQFEIEIEKTKALHKPVKKAERERTQLPDFRPGEEEKYSNSYRNGSSRR
jgi:hypothetical protein